MAGPRRKRPGFTLIELLVVIIVIGILVALLLPAISGVLRRTRNGAIAMEISGISNAIEAFKADYGAYPPDFEEFDQNRFTSAFPNAPGQPRVFTWQQMAQTASGRFVRKNFPQIGSRDLTFLAQAAPAIDNAEVLVFWLHGLSSNPKAPFTDEGGPGDFTVTGGGHSHETHKFRFDFKLDQLRDQDSDGFLEYYPKYAPVGGVPYVYFNAKNYTYYAGRDSNGNPSYGHAFHEPVRKWTVQVNYSGAPVYANVDPYPAAAIAQIGVALPQKSVEPRDARPGDNHRGAALHYVNRSTFQLICGGQDGFYGPMRSLFPSGKPLPDGAGFPAPSTTDTHVGLAPEDRDNLTNYSEGKPLEAHME